MLRTLVAALAISTLAGAAFAVPLQADFRAEFDLPDGGFSSGPRVLEALAEPVDGAPDLGLANEIANPSLWSGGASIDLDSGGLITLATQDSDVFDTAFFSISNIIFSSGERIIGVIALTNSLLDIFEPGVVPLETVLFTSNSVTIGFDATGQGTDADFELAGGGIATYQLQLAVIPLPAGLPLLLGALGTFAILRRKRA